MAKYLSTVNTNEPFTTTKCQLLFYLPEGLTINVWASVDGHEWEDITGSWFGPQLCSIVAIPDGTYFKFVSATQTKISFYK
jgi:hypothetical protein